MELDILSYKLYYFLIQERTLHTMIEMSGREKGIWHEHVNSSGKEGVIRIMAFPIHLNRMGHRNL
jgi:hypothetical protein